MWNWKLLLSYWHWDKVFLSASVFSCQCNSTGVLYTSFVCGCWYIILSVEQHTLAAWIGREHGNKLNEYCVTRCPDIYINYMRSLCYIVSSQGCSQQSILYSSYFRVLYLLCMISPFCMCICQHVNYFISIYKTSNRYDVIIPLCLFNFLLVGISAWHMCEILSGKNSNTTLFRSPKICSTLQLLLGEYLFRM
jgi:hypothetical protein